MIESEPAAVMEFVRYVAIGLGVLVVIVTAVGLGAGRLHRVLLPYMRRKFGPARRDALKALRDALVSPGSPIERIEMDWQHGYPLFCVLIVSYEPLDDVRRAGGLCHQVRQMAQEIVRADVRFGKSGRKFDAWQGVWFMSDCVEFNERGRSPDNWWNW